MNKIDFELITGDDRDDLLEFIDILTPLVWPEFMLHDVFAGKHWSAMYNCFPNLQFALVEPESGNIVAGGNSVALYWDKPFDELPDQGWDWQLVESIRQHREGIKPNTQGAIQVMVHPDFQNQGLSSIMVQIMKELGQEAGLEYLIAPVRPPLRYKYRDLSMDEYCRKTDADGWPIDSWMRVHARLGASLVKVCPEAMEIRGSVAEWEKWTGQKFDITGEYLIDRALEPIRIDIENDKGLYIEPNFWMVHEL